MVFKILIVEDNKHKRDRVTSVVKNKIFEADIDYAYSFTSGSNQSTNYQYDLIILDISLPTYDKIGNESGGRFRTFGGKEIARKIKRRGIKTNLIFITQYEAFSDKGRSYSLAELENDIRTEHGEQCLDLIYYDSSKSVWKEKLIEALNGTRS